MEEPRRRRRRKNRRRRGRRPTPGALGLAPRPACSAAPPARSSVPSFPRLRLSLRVSVPRLSASPSLCSAPSLAAFLCWVSLRPGLSVTLALCPRLSCCAPHPWGSRHLPRLVLAPVPPPQDAAGPWLRDPNFKHFSPDRGGCANPASE